MSNDLKVAIEAKVNNSNNIRASTKVKTSSTLKAEMTAAIINGGSTDHSKLKNLDYDASGHIGFASEKQLQKYAAKTELPESLSNLEIEEILQN